MNVKYEITSFDKDTGSVLVRYFTDNNPIGYVYNVDVPINNGEYVSEVELNEHIEHLSPKSQLERIEQVKTANIPKFLSDLISVKSSV